MPSESERHLILAMIQQGKITADEGLRLLKALDADSEEPEALLGTGEPDTDAIGIENLAAPAGEAEPLENVLAQEAGAAAGMPAESAEARPGLQEAQPEGRDLPPEMKRWRGWWTIPLWVGVALMVLAGIWMYNSLQASGVGFIFLCSSLPFLLGLVIIVLAWQSRTARWLHLRVWQKKHEWPEKLSISFPLPLGLASWGLRNFKHKIPGLAHTSVDELIQALDQSASSDAPFFVEVEDDEDGERVQVYIG